MSDTADVVVIGAGVIGAAVANELARRGRAVVCVDAGPAVGAGSTSASSAIIRFQYSTRDSVITAWESAHLWWDLSVFLGVDDPDGMVRFVKTGLLTLDYPDHNRDVVLGHLDAVGVPYEVFDAAALRRRWPGLSAGDFSPPKRLDDPAFGDEPDGDLGGYYLPDAGFIDDPMRAAGNFMHAARHRGAALRLDCEVVEISTAAGRVAGVKLANGDSIDAPVVVNVAGPASARVNQLAGVTDEMAITHRPLRQEVHVVEAPTEFGLENGTIVGDLGSGVYIRPHLGNTLLIGGTEPACDPMEWVDDPDEFHDRATVDGMERNTWRAARRIPSLGIPRRPIGLAALYDASDDWVPIYDKSSLDGFYMACGTSGNQFKNAPLAGRFMAELIEAAESGVDHDLDPVRVVGAVTGLTINLGCFSRLRDPSETSGTVMG